MLGKTKGIGDVDSKTIEHGGVLVEVAEALLLGRQRLLQRRAAPRRRVGGVQVIRASRQALSARRRVLRLPHRSGAQHDGYHNRRHS